MKRWRWTVVVVLLAAAACSSGGGGDSLTIRQLATKVGCPDFRSDSDELFVAAAGYCDKTGGDIATFNDNDARDSWLQAASAFGGVCAVGDRWVVCGPSRTVIERLGRALGGDVRG